MKFDHCALQVTNLDAAIEFYTKKLGFLLLSIDVSEQHKIKYAFLDLNGSKIELLEDLNAHFTKPNISAPFCPHYCIEVENMDTAVNILKENGIEIVSGPTACVAGELLVYFKDPDGNTFEYIQWLYKNDKNKGTQNHHALDTPQ